MNSTVLTEPPVCSIQSSPVANSAAGHLASNAILSAVALNTNSPNNSNDSSHNLSTASNVSTASISTLNKVLETQPKSTDSGIGSEKSW